MTNPLTALALCDRCGGMEVDPICLRETGGCGGTGRKTVTLAPEGRKALFRELVEDRVQDVCDDVGNMEIPTPDGTGALVDAEQFLDWFAPEVRAHPEHGKGGG